ncbi:MAG: serine/threonine protein kinase, partial [Acidimicrobiia bacterium]|nr:serine/threonine protein kinase [Acidimicrobiia bacterium]
MDGPVGSVSDAPLPTIEGVADLVAIGRGGFGTVYRGRQPHLDRDVAVKVLDRSDADGLALRRFEREVGAMGRLSNHPNIVAVYDGGVTAEGRPYLVMPFVPGGSLGDLLRRDGSLAPELVAAMGAKLAGALASTHAAGVLHRDVKPDNVLISPYGEPQLTDFGIARLADATTTAWQSVALTVHYAAPEVLGGEPASPASDVYALGATLHACLTGTPPFKGEPGEALMVVVGRIATQPAPDLRAAGIDEPLATVVEQALAKDPTERIATADDLRRRLEAVIAPPGAAAGGGPTRTEQLPVYLPPATVPDAREEVPSPAAAPIPAATPLPTMAAPIPPVAAPIPPVESAPPPTPA